MTKENHDVFVELNRMIVTPKGIQRIYHMPKKCSALRDDFACMHEISDMRLQFPSFALLVSWAGAKDSSNAVKKDGTKEQVNPAQSQVQSYNKRAPPISLPVP